MPSIAGHGSIDRNRWARSPWWTSPARSRPGMARPGPGSSTPGSTRGGAPGRSTTRACGREPTSSRPGSSGADVDAFLLSFGVIFLAELGDKSQLMALAFATRFPAGPVLVAISIATLIVHLGSVALGATVAIALPRNLIAIVAGVAFLVFAAWTLRGDELGEEDRAKAS